MKDDLGAIAFAKDPFKSRRYIGVWEVPANRPIRSRPEYLLISCGPKGGNREIISTLKTKREAVKRFKAWTWTDREHVALARRLAKAAARLDD